MKLTTVVQKIQSYLQNGDHVDPRPLPSLPFVVEEARREWLDAQYYYNTVTDQDLIDHAVYLMQAAEKKYIYLLKQARNAGAVYSPYARDFADVSVNKDELITH